MPQEKREKGSTKKKSTEQKSSIRSQPSTANSSNWNVKQVVVGVAGVLCLIIVIAAVVQQKRGTSNHASMNNIFLCHVSPNYFCFSFHDRERNHCKATVCFSIEHVRVCRVPLDAFDVSSICLQEVIVQCRSR